MFPIKTLRGPKLWQDNGVSSSTIWILEWRKKSKLSSKIKMSKKVLIVPIIVASVLYSKYYRISLIFKRGEEGHSPFAGALSMSLVFMSDNPALFPYKLQESWWPKVYLSWSQCSPRPAWPLSQDRSIINDRWKMKRVGELVNEPMSESRERKRMR